jgi:hypothetical protein
VSQRALHAVVASDAGHSILWWQRAAPQKVRKSPHPVVKHTSGTLLEEVPSTEPNVSPGWRHVRWQAREGWIAAQLLSPAR